MLASFKADRLRNDPLRRASAVGGAAHALERDGRYLSEGFLYPGQVLPEGRVARVKECAWWRSGFVCLALSLSKAMTTCRGQQIRASCRSHGAPV